jgi:hypothetical protein
LKVEAQALSAGRTVHGDHRAAACFHGRAVAQLRTKERRNEGVLGYAHARAKKRPSAEGVGDAAGLIDQMFVCGESDAKVIELRRAGA